MSKKWFWKNYFLRNKELIESRKLGYDRLSVKFFKETLSIKRLSSTKS